MNLNNGFLSRASALSLPELATLWAVDFFRLRKRASETLLGGNSIIVLPFVLVSLRFFFLQIKIDDLGRKLENSVQKKKKKKKKKTEEVGYREMYSHDFF